MAGKKKELFDDDDASSSSSSSSSSSDDSSTSSSPSPAKAKSGEKQQNSKANTDDELRITVNKKFAAKYQSKKEQEELQFLGGQRKLNIGQGCFF